MEEAVHKAFLKVGYLFKHDKRINSLFNVDHYLNEIKHLLILGLLLIHNKFDVLYQA